MELGYKTDEREMGKMKDEEDRPKAERERERRRRKRAVSYTHLTLPTIYSV